MTKSATIINIPIIIINGIITHINITIAIKDSSKSFIIYPP